MTNPLRIYHIPNPPHKGFFFAVQSIDEAKLALNVCACLDLEQFAFKIHDLDPNRHLFIDHVASKYRQYRRSRSINGAWLIDCNVQGLQVQENGEWVEWYNEDGEDISDILREESLFPNNI